MTTRPAPAPDSKPQDELAVTPPPVAKEELTDNIGQARQRGIVDDEELAWSGTKGGIVGDVLLADNTAKGRKGGIVDDELLAKSGKSGGFAEDEQLAGSGRKGGFAADDTELA